MGATRGSEPSRLWQEWRERVDLDEYDARFDKMAEDGANVHGEADFIQTLVAGLETDPGGCRLLDAGCGTGRVAIELAGRGFPVVAMDNDLDMLKRAEAKSDDVVWQLGDISRASFDGDFDLIYLAGDVLVYVEPTRRHLVVANLIRSLKPGGLLVSGTGFAPAFSLEGYDDWCRRAGMRLFDRYSTWDRDPFLPGSDYAVSVHRLPNLV